jgi:DNA transformation protein and related proteins
MVKAADPLGEYLVDQLRDWAPVAVRRLFGGWGIYRGSLMFGLIARDAVYFRVDEHNRPDYEEAAAQPFLHSARRRAGAAASAAKPFTYRMPNGKTVEMAYYEVPADILEDPEVLVQWAAKSEAAALRAKAGKIKRPGSQRKRRGK